MVMVAYLFMKQCSDFIYFIPGAARKKRLIWPIGLNEKSLASWKLPGSEMVGPTRSIVQVVGTDFPP